MLVKGPHEDSKAGTAEDFLEIWKHHRDPVSVTDSCGWARQRRDGAAEPSQVFGLWWGMGLLRRAGGGGGGVAVGETDGGGRHAPSVAESRSQLPGHAGEEESPCCQATGTSRFG